MKSKYTINDSFDVRIFDKTTEETVYEGNAIVSEWSREGMTIDCNPGSVVIAKSSKTCDICEKEEESNYSNNLEKYMCENCWDNYGEMCHLGLA